MDLSTFKWMDFGEFIEIETPDEFSFYECMVYLNRSDIECLHKVKDNELYKLLRLDDLLVLFKVGVAEGRMRITFLNTVPLYEVKEQIAGYVWKLFDLGTDLESFYEKAKGDEILSLLVNKYRGLRIVKINDFFEGLSWAIIGQQINLKFAYTLKRRLVEKYGEQLNFDGENYFIFPAPEQIAGLSVEELRELQFTQKKAEYLIGVAKLFEDGLISKEILEMEKDYEKLKSRLVAIRGVGNWTADYAIMKCFNLNSAFPIADVGIHNALKGILGLDKKPSLKDIEDLANNWKEWEAYAAFYIWRWLYD